VKQGQVIAKGIMLLPARTIVWLLVQRMVAIPASMVLVCVLITLIALILISASIIQSG